MLLEDFAEGDTRREDLNTILKETRRLDRIVNQIVDYARPRDFLPVRFRLEELLEESLKVLSELVKQRAIQVRHHRPTSLSSLYADRDQLKQVLLNILQNAIEAMPVHGTLHLSIVEELYEHHQGLRLKVEDSGKGIDPQVLSKIFEPFFTMGKHRGTGLGLAICRNIIEAHGGEIHAESPPKLWSYDFSVAP